MACNLFPALLLVLEFCRVLLRLTTAEYTAWALRRVPRALVVSTVHRGPFGTDVVDVGVMGGGVLARWEASMPAFGGRMVLLRLDAAVVG